MKIKNIADLKRNVNQATFLLFIVLIIAGLAMHYMYKKFLDNKYSYEQGQVVNTLNIYKSNLSEKLSIIASSTIFLDYLRSGPQTREYLYPQFLTQLATLKAKSIIGMELVDNFNQTIFKHGENSGPNVALKLCYLNQALDAEMGICEYEWKLYFDKNYLQDELVQLNQSLGICKNCASYPLVKGDFFGSFPVKEVYGLSFNIASVKDRDSVFYLYFLLVMGCLFIFSSLSWYRLSDVLNNYIANPIKHLANCLKANEVLNHRGNIEEIQCLIEGINAWKELVNKAQKDEHAAKLGQVAAQLAHDIRSPLMAIEMINKKNSNVPDNYKIMMQQAIQRISDIANGFLAQYRGKKIINSELGSENIAQLLEGIILEKRQQYADQILSIDFEKNYDDVFCLINAADFNRVISNIINNSVEACKFNKAIINISLLRSANEITIVINDNGLGIPPEILPVIFDGVSVGKKNGSGLGLSHAKEKINEWGGSLNVTSKYGYGAKVELHLPLIC